MKPTTRRIREMAAKYIRLMATLTPKIPRPQVRSEMYDTS